MRFSAIFNLPEKAAIGEHERTNLLRPLVWYLILILIAFSTGMAVFFQSDPSRILFIVVSIIIIGLINFFLLKRGRSLLAAVSFVFLFWVLITGLTITGGGTATVAFIGFLFVVLFSGMLLGARAGAVTAVACIVSEIIITYLEVNGLLPKNVHQTPYTRLIGNILFISFILVIIFYSTKQYESTEQEEKADAARASGSAKKIPAVLISIFILVSSGLVIGGYLFYSYQKRAIISAAESELKNIATLKTRQIEDWRDERVGDASVLSEDIVIKSLCDPLRANQINSSSRSALAEWLDLVRKNYDYEAISLFSSDKHLICASGKMEIDDSDLSYLFETVMQ